MEKQEEEKEEDCPTNIIYSVSSRGFCWKKKLKCTRVWLRKCLHSYLSMFYTVLFFPLYQLFLNSILTTHESFKLWIRLTKVSSLQGIVMPPIGWSYIQILLRLDSTNLETKVGSSKIAGWQNASSVLRHRP